MRMGSPATNWPDRLLGVAFIRRAAALWTAIHIFVLAGSGGTVMSLEPLPAIAMVAMAAGLGVFDAKKRHELLLLQNMGVRPAMVMAIWAGVALLLETLATLAEAAWR